MNLLIALLFFASSPLISSDLNSLWNEALKSPSEESIQKWTDWIQEAKTQNLVVPEAYYNLAQSYWSQNQISLSVYNLLLSAQLRFNIFSAWGDLAQINRIQKALLDSPSPMDSWSLRLSLLFNEQVRLVGKVIVAWILILILFLRYGFAPPKKGGLFLLMLGFVIFAVGFAADRSRKSLNFPSILNHKNELVPIYQSAEINDETPILELPSGLLVMTETEKGDRIKINHPTPGWIKKEMMLPFPRPF
ncbi:MAG: hypothetical protein EBQ92_02660 [Proteobacteria bacterium]|nr:hypothetical protein [Pseudomonadota bacterium]